MLLVVGDEIDAAAVAVGAGFLEEAVQLVGHAVDVRAELHECEPLDIVNMSPISIRRSSGYDVPLEEVGLPKTKSPAP